MSIKIQERKKLQELGASMLSGMMIPTHKEIRSIKPRFVQVITVATLDKPNMAHKIHTVYRDELYNVWMLPVEDFRLRFKSMDEE